MNSDPATALRGFSPLLFLLVPSVAAAQVPLVNPTITYTSVELSRSPQGDSRQMVDLNITGFQVTPPVTSAFPGASTNAVSDYDIYGFSNAFDNTSGVNITFLGVVQPDGSLDNSPADYSFSRFGDFKVSILNANRAIHATDPTFRFITTEASFISSRLTDTNQTFDFYKQDGTVFKDAFGNTITASPTPAPVPEASSSLSFGVLMVGLVGLVWNARRRKGASQGVFTCAK